MLKNIKYVFFRVFYVYNVCINSGSVSRDWSNIKLMYNKMILDAIQNVVYIGYTKTTRYFIFLDTICIFLLFFCSCFCVFCVFVFFMCFVWIITHKNMLKTTKYANRTPKCEIITFLFMYHLYVQLSSLPNKNTKYYTKTWNTQIKKTTIMCKTCRKTWSYVFCCVSCVFCMHFGNTHRCVAKIYRKRLQCKFTQNTPSLNNILWS